MKFFIVPLMAAACSNAMFIDNNLIAQRTFVPAGPPLLSVAKIDSVAENFPNKLVATVANIAELPQQLVPVDTVTSLSGIGFADKGIIGKGFIGNGLIGTGFSGFDSGFSGAKGIVKVVKVAGFNGLNGFNKGLNAFSGFKTSGFH
jgi:hypothetical protein